MKIKSKGKIFVAMSRSVFVGRAMSRPPNLSTVCSLPSFGASGSLAGGRALVCGEREGEHWAQGCIVVA
jgi:hypothetical protein